MGSSHPKHKKQSPKQAPKQQIHSTNFQSQSENAFAQSQMASQQPEQQQQTRNAMPFKNKKQDFATIKHFKGQRKSNFSPSSARQQKQFFKQFENQNSRRPAYKS